MTDQRRKTPGGRPRNRIFQYEHRTQPLLPGHLFLRRIGQHALAAATLIGGSLGLGVLGYHIFEGLSWLDALLNASMILAGMGPVGELHSRAGKFFASFYALFSGVVFLIIAGVLLAPLAHRILHRLHLEGTKDKGTG